MNNNKTTTGVGQTQSPRPSVFRLDKHLYSLYLFTASDFVSVLIPQSLFATFSALSGQFTVDKTVPVYTTVLARVPHVLAWIWLQLLVLDLSNQRLPDSIEEDKLNKPWRPIPSGRVTAEDARKLLLVSIAGTLAATRYLGATEETLVLFTLNWLYNDLGMANDHWLLRNLANALGITGIGAGAMRVACGLESELDTPAAWAWWFFCACMLLTTIHAQDLYDQEGDAARGRATAPLVLGPMTARWSIALCVLAWSVVMPAVTGMRLPQDWTGYATPVVLGWLVAARILVLHTVPDDKLSFKAWALWTICLYALPLVKIKGLDFHGLFSTRGLEFVSGIY